MSLLSGIEGAIGGAVGDIFGGGSGGGDFLSELMDAFDGGSSQSSGSGSGTMGDIGQIAGDVLPLLAMF